MSGSGAEVAVEAWRAGEALSNNDLDEFAALIERERERLMSAWRTQVRQLPSAAGLDTPTLNDHMPGILVELAMALRSRSDETIAETLMEGSPPAHGVQRADEGFDIAEIVAEYNILRGCIHDLATAAGLVVQGRAFHIVNRVLDNAIGIAVQTFAAHQAAEVQKRREEYLGFVMHDLRTPLNAVALAARVLERTLPAALGEGQSGKMFSSMRRNVLQLETLVGKILDENVHVKTGVGVKIVKRHLDLWPLVEALFDDLYPVSGTRHAQLINVVPGDLVVYADAVLLRRVFQNLIANAIKYAPSGEITVGAKSIESNSAVECWVSDDGLGIKKELLESVFEKGKTGGDEAAGTGLGLAIVKTFIEAHGGIVSVESVEGCGSKFRFSLPN